MLFNLFTFITILAKLSDTSVNCTSCVKYMWLDNYAWLRHIEEIRITKNY